MTTARKQKMPAILFYTGDWLKDPAVRCVSLPARGLWIDMLCLMYESPTRGYLSLASGKAVEPTQLARMVGTTVDEVEKLLEELQDCGVFSLDECGVIFSRRMVEDEIRRQNKSKAGKRGMRSRYQKEDNDDSVSTSVITEQQQNSNRPPNKLITPLEYEYETESVRDIELININSPELFSEKKSVEFGWSKIPKNRQRGKGNFSRAWIAKVVHACVDPKVAADGLAAYYASQEGKGKYWRFPATAVTDEVWTEDKTLWGETRGEVKFPQSAFGHAKIIKKYSSMSEKNRENVKKLESGEMSESRIAYKIWKKYPDILSGS